MLVQEKEVGARGTRHSGVAPDADVHELPVYSCTLRCLHEFLKVFVAFLLKHRWRTNVPRRTAREHRRLRMK